MVGGYEAGQGIEMWLEKTTVGRIAQHLEGYLRTSASPVSGMGDRGGY